MSTSKYNSLGQLKTKYQANATQKIDYLYNIRGWLTQMNNPDSLGSSLFAMKLNYNERLDALNTSGLYNGNISSMIWANKYSLGTELKSAYGFTYDGAKRLTTAVYGEGNNLTANKGAYNASYSYDKNGNINTLIRRNESIVMDSLIYEYSGNKLLSIFDYGEATISGGFNETQSAYTYDANGNMNNNTGKQLSLTYNTLNLPTQIDNGVNGKMQFIYNTAGQKLRTALEGSNAYLKKTTDYVSNYVYIDKKLSYILLPEGRILVTESAEVPNGITFDYEYHLKDQLGNTRATYIAGANGTSTISQTTAYYPFGLPINALSSNLENNPYLYNGKELHNELNMDLLDYGARFYDAEAIRFWTIDPLAEKYSFQSLYVYAANNPISFIDLNGENASPIYDYDGKFLGNDSEGFYGDILVMDKSLYNSLSNGGKEILDNDFITSSNLAIGINDAIEGGAFTVEELANVYNNIIEQAGYDLNETGILNGSVSIYSNYYNLSEGEGKYNAPRGFDIRMTDTGTANATALETGFSGITKPKIGINTFIRGGTNYNAKTNTISGGSIPKGMRHSGNVVSILYAHEALGHGKGINGFSTSESVAYTVQRYHASFNNVSSDYKQHVIKQLKRYGISNAAKQKTLGN